MFIFKQNNNIVIILLPSVPSFHKEKTTFTIISQNIEFFTLLSIMGFTFAEEDANLKYKCQMIPKSLCKELTLNVSKLYTCMYKFEETGD